MKGVSEFLAAGARHASRAAAAEAARIQGKETQSPYEPEAATRQSRSPARVARARLEGIARD